MSKNNILLLLILIIAFFLRVTTFTFPAFTSDEARIASRGYNIVTSGRDELGRLLPLLFNSLTDYQLPATTYITALGEIVLGKNDLGARIPFILLGIALVFVTYKTAQIFSQRKLFWVISALVLSISPALIFLSKVPNDSIVLTFSIMLLFYFLVKDKLNIFLIILILFLLLTISKFAWFVLAPFVVLTLLFYQDNLPRKSKVKFFVSSLLLVIIVMGFYLRIPQSNRSLSENNFSIFSNITIKNGINKLRGQGIESGWPNYLEIILFNKSHFFTIGFMHWLSNLQPSIYFGQLDKSGGINFSQTGGLSRILIIPFITGIIYLIRRGRKKERLLLIYFIILTFPAFFIYPDFSQKLVVLTFPFAAFIIAYGFMQFNRITSIILVLIMILEAGLNLFYIFPKKEDISFSRPSWIKEVAQDVYKESVRYTAAVSDDIAEDVLAYIEWYSPADLRTGYVDVPYPYKFRQSSIKNIKIIGSDNEPYSCKEVSFDKVFVSKRDLDKVKNSDTVVVKTYHNDLNQETVYLLEKGLCIK